MIAIIDYDAGNLKSVEKALAHIGEESVITRDFQTILNADKVILPGVGAFGDAMANLKRLELDKVIRELNEKQTPFLYRKKVRHPHNMVINTVVRSVNFHWSDIFFMLCYLLLSYSPHRFCSRLDHIRVLLSVFFARKTYAPGLNR